MKNPMKNSLLESPHADGKNSWLSLMAATSLEPLMPELSPSEALLPLRPPRLRVSRFSRFT